MSEPADNASFSFVEMEHDILKLWQDTDAFQQSLANTRGKKPYIFYDGPPFATGLPHHGHLVASTIKDVVPRYWTMKGRYVMRRFGWDCHGLPVEHEIDKQLGMSAQDAVEKLGVAGYNNECRAIVQRYVKEWRHTITRIGRWIDFDNDYKTMDAWYMESVWWVFKQLWDKGLIYQGVKVVPVSTALGTPLANFEATSNYQDVQDPAITVLLKLLDEDAYLAIWTTTPWTLPSNLAVCVGDHIEYSLVRDSESGKAIYLATERLSHYQGDNEFTVLATVSGRELVGRRYQPVFDYFAEKSAEGAFVVISGEYVTTDSGTGLVHQAPAFGEDDYKAFQASGLDAFACPVTLQGEFTEEVPDFAGRHVKDADKDIIAALKASGALYRQEVIQHSYPYCYRSDTPLIYRAIPSWYVRVTSIKDNLKAANEKINWVPEHIKHGRFGNWLDGAIDWAISRNRVWGTPLPVWINDETGNALCVGSIEELYNYTGVRVEDLHREHVDALTFQFAGEAGTYRRIEEVLDCWFESGSMPYAQLHYPFENEDVFEAGFPAEFIAEGLDQTRGWFYTLTVLGAGLFDQPAFRNVIVNGMVMAEDGKKMSKSLRNYTPPDELMETYGADALRLYSINSGLVKGEEQRFADSGVRDMVRRALLPWYNAYSFLRTYAEIDEWSPQKGQHEGENILDQWIMSRLQTLKQTVATEMEGYRLYNVVPALFAFIEDLTNWYIRLNRGRFWGADISADKIAAYSTLYEVLLELSKVMAPFAPFLSEHLYQALAQLAGQPAQPNSVHLCDYPEAEAESVKVKPGLETAVERMQQVILLGRQKREEVKIGLRTPLSSLTIVNSDQALLDDMRSIERYVQEELNVQAVEYATDEAAYIELCAKPNFPLLGKRLGKRMKAFAAAIAALTPEQIGLLQQSGTLELTVDGAAEVFNAEEVRVQQQARAGTNTISNSQIAVDLNCELTPELVRGGYAREVVNRIQRARKDMNFAVSDRITVHFSASGELAQAIDEHRDYVMHETLCVTLANELDADAGTQTEIDGHSLGFTLQRQGE
ncbi:MAG: isoleucine--tRNA ligase [Gammaproteobacteria bacterium]|nr:isoleucine--tRNA ligase [Gammaproteobacteria bacterium]